MRKKSGFTIVEQTIILIPKFEKVVRKLEQQVALRGQSASTLKNYIRRIALFVVHFGKLPEQIDPDEINEYLAALARDPGSPSRSSFKHMVYGLRYYYRLLGMNKNAIALPSLKKDTKLPVILNHQEFAPEGKPDIQTLIKQQLPPETSLQQIERHTGINPCLCPVCKTGRMAAVRELPRIRSPAWHRSEQFQYLLNNLLRFAL